MSVKNAELKKSRRYRPKRKKRIMFTQAPEFADDTPIGAIKLPTRIHNALLSAGLTTVGQVRETTDTELMRLQNFAEKSLAYVRRQLGAYKSSQPHV
jgi:DNA-directed RNA polymerase alpha subunit